jgi:hypothetical protein
MHKFLYICMGVETLVVLFKCLKSSIHKFLYICMGVETLVVSFKCPESSLRLLSRVVHAYAFVHMHGG